MVENSIKITEKGICFSSLEFTILCNACGIQDLICFEQSDGQPGERETLQVLLEMVKRGLLIQEGDTFSLGDEILSIMDVIAERKYTIMLRIPESEISDCCIYIGSGENMVLAGPGVREGEYIVLKILPKSILGVFLESGGYIPKSEISEEIRQIRKIIEETENAGVEYTPFGEEGPDKYRFKAEIYNGKQDIKHATLYVYWDKGNELLLEISELGKVADYYSEDKLIGDILQLAGINVESH